MANLDFIEQIKNLSFPENQFAVFGSGPLAIRSLRKSNDIDIIVKVELWSEVSKKYKVSNTDKAMIRINDIEIFKSWNLINVSVDELIDSADVIEGIRFVKLKYVLDWKKNLGRPKDLEDIKLIEEYLREKN